MKARHLLLLLLLGVSASGVGAQTRSNSGKIDTQSQRIEPSVDKARSNQLAHEVATIFFSYKDQRAKSWALSQLADVLWAYDEDTARQFMLSALETCSLSSSQSKSEREMLLSRRRTLISIISSHDAAWAETLIEDDQNFTDLERQEVNLSTAYKLLEGPFEKSAGFIERARKTGLPDDLPFYLQALRSKSSSAADALFASALSQLSGQSYVPAEVILSYATYVFSAPGKSPYTISMKAVGSSMVYDISVNREGISPDLIKLYLLTAAVVLERNLQTVDPSQIGLNYYTSRLMLEKAQQVAPDLVGAFRSHMAVNANRVPEAYATDPPKRQAIPASSTNGGTAAAEEGEDDLLAAFFDQWLQKNYVAAQKVLDKVSAPALREDLQQVLTFKQIADDIEKGVSPAKIKPLISKLPRGLESALLWCGLANAYVRQAKQNGAKESLIAAVSASSQVKDHRRPYLLLNVAKIYAAFNPPMASLTFKEAVKQFNTLESEYPTNVSWQRKVEAQQLNREFSLRLNGLSGDVADLVQDFAREEDSDVYSALLTLKDERLKARSLISYLKFNFASQKP